MQHIYRQMVDHFGGQAATARALGVYQSNVHAWVNGVMHMGPAAAARAEKASNGTFRRRDLCPRFDWDAVE